MSRRSSVTSQKHSEWVASSAASSIDLQARDRELLLSGSEYAGPPPLWSTQPRKRVWPAKRVLFYLSVGILLLGSVGMLASTEGAASQLARTSCLVKSRFGLATDGIGCPNVISGPSHYVPVWTAEPFPGQVDKRELSISAGDKIKYNVTDVFAAMRTAVIDTHPHWGSEWRMIRIIGGVYDLPFHPDRHLWLSSLFENESSPYQMRASIPNDIATGEEQKVIYGRKDFRDGRDIQFSIPAAPFNVTESKPRHGTTGRKVIPLTFELTLKDVPIATWTFQLRVKWIPYSKMSICMKPLYGEDVPSMLVEWREHHRILGWPLVHWQHRHAGLGKVIEKLNKLTGGYDTFDHSPLLEPNELREDIWDERMTFNECYVRYKQASEFIGVWDLDEYAAPTPDKPWTADWVADYLAANWSNHYPEAAYLQMPMTWLDKKRFGPIPDEKLSAIDPGLTEEDLHDISSLHLSTDGYQERHQEFYVKSIHRTAKIRGANIHHGWGGAATWQDPVKLVIYHARRDQYWSRDLFKPWPINDSVVAHWKKLAQHIRRRKLNKVYELEIAE